MTRPQDAAKSSVGSDALRRQDEQRIERRIGGQEILERTDLGLSGAVQGEAKEDDASVRTALADHQFAKVFVVGDQDPLLAVGQGEDLFIRQTWGVVAADTGGVMPPHGEKERNPRLGAFVQQEPHGPG